MNCVQIIGRLCKDVDIKTVALKDGDLSVARYTLAVDRRGKKDEADFISCVCFGKTADFAAKYLCKGTKIAVTGRIQTGSYEKDGRKIYTTDVVVENHYFCDSKKADKKEEQEEPADYDDFMSIPAGIEDDMPFARG